MYIAKLCIVSKCTNMLQWYLSVATHIPSRGLTVQYVSDTVDAINDTEGSTQTSKIHSRELKQSTTNIRLLGSVAGPEGAAALLGWRLWCPWLYDGWFMCCLVVSLHGFEYRTKASRR